MAHAIKPKNEPPSAAEWAALNSFLASNGYTPQQRKDAIGQTPNGRSRAEISNSLKSWQKDNIQ